MIASLSASAGVTAMAQWTGAAGNNLVDDPDNWTGGVINGVFAPTITGSNLALQTTGDVMFSSGLNFSHANEWSLTIEPSTVATRTFTLGGNINVDIAGNAATTGTKVIRLGSSANSRPIVLDLDGGTRTLAVNSALSATANGRDTFILWGDITNGSLVKTGGGSAEFNNALSLSGDFIHEGGYTQLLSSSSLLSVNKLVVGGSLGRFVIKSSATNRLNDSAAVHLAGGIFGFQAVGNTSETIGTVYLQGARSAAGLINGTLHMAELVRDQYSTLALVGSSTNRFGTGANKITVGSDANILSSLKGGGGAAGSTTVSILPWATATTAISNSFTDAFDSRYYSADFGFVTYTTAGGFRALDKTTEYVGTVAGSSNAADNIRLTADETLAAGKTINSLFLDKSSALVLNLGGQTLNVTSGAVAAGNNQITISNGTLNFGSNTGFIMLGRNSNNAISASLAGSAGVVFAMTPDQPLTISGANTYTGRTVINSGTLALGANNTLPTGTDVRIDKTGTLRVNNGISQSVASLSGSGVVQLSNTAARLDVGDSVANSAAGVVTIGNGGSVSVGDDAGHYQVSQLTFTGASLAFEAGSVLDIDIASALSFDSINLSTAGKTVTVAGGTISLSFLNAYAPEAGDSFQLFSIAGVAVTDSVVNAGNFTIVGPAGYTFSLDSTGLLTVVSAIPEPSTYAVLLAGAALTAGAVRRRRG